MFDWYWFVNYVAMNGPGHDCLAASSCYFWILAILSPMLCHRLSRHWPWSKCKYFQTIHHHSQLHSWTGQIQVTSHTCWTCYTCACNNQKCQDQNILMYCYIIMVELRLEWWRDYASKKCLLRLRLAGITCQLCEIWRVELIRDTDTLDTDPELSDHQINSERGNNEEMFTRNTDTNTDTQHYCSLILVFLFGSNTVLDESPLVSELMMSENTLVSEERLVMVLVMVPFSTCHMLPTVHLSSHCFKMSNIINTQITYQPWVSFRCGYSKIFNI